MRSPSRHPACRPESRRVDFRERTSGPSSESRIGPTVHPQWVADFSNGIMGIFAPALTLGRGEVRECCAHLRCRLEFAVGPSMRHLAVLAHALRGCESARMGPSRPPTVRCIEERPESNDAFPDTFKINSRSELTA